MPDKRAQKGNPAAHRMNNKALQARRASSWARGRKRKEARQKSQAEAEKRNAELREQGLPTPWEESKAKRYGARNTGVGTSSDRGTKIRSDGG